MQMPDTLPRVVGVKLAAEPRKSFICVQGVDELAKMARLPKGLPKGAVAHQFLTEFNKGTLKPKPILFSAKLNMTVKNP
jgi:hypothetical protein